MVNEMKNKKWITVVFALTFALSVIFSFVTNMVTDNVSNLFLLWLLLFIVIIIGIIFDMIGTAALTSNEATFHSMSSKKVSGAKESLVLIKNCEKISSICNDVVGDVCGIISGGLGAIIAIGITTKTGLNNVVVSIGVSAIISSLTVGGKAIFKGYATRHADSIIHLIGKLNKKVTK